MSARIGSRSGLEAAAVADSRERTRARVNALIRALGLFALLFWFQVGHMVEHLSLAFRGQPLLGAEADSQLFHLVFNLAIALLAIAILIRHPRNPWAYPLALVCVLHEAEDVYVYVRFVATTGALNGAITEGEAGLLGADGALHLLPIQQLDLHNLYNGLEWILVTLGFWHQVDDQLQKTSA